MFSQINDRVDNVVRDVDGLKKCGTPSYTHPTTLMRVNESDACRQRSCEQQQSKRNGQEIVGKLIPFDCNGFGGDKFIEENQDKSL